MDVTCNVKGKMASHPLKFNNRASQGGRVPIASARCPAMMVGANHLTALTVGDAHHGLYALVYVGSTNLTGAS